MTKSLMRKYARLIAKTGANIKKGQPVIIYADIDQGEFIAILADECYKAGAVRVEVEWSYQPLTKLHYRYRSLKTLSEVPAWKEAKLKNMTEELPCRIHIMSEDPDGLKGINRDKMQKSRIATYAVTKQYSDAIENRHQWTIAAVPSRQWAKKVFPEQRVSKAYEMLWDAILKSVYVSADNDPQAEWAAHNRSLKEKCDLLNAHAFDYLEYKSSNGTDFKAWLMPQSRWHGGKDATLSGNEFNANIPTEEIFTSPKRGFAEGTLVSTKPLSYNGQLIENFSITFKDGKASDWQAEKGKDLLDKMISMDEGAAYLGELALVPYDSPINNSGILFYNTLFDENASCHVALGKGFADVIDGYESLTAEQCAELGLNDSMIHVDFMIGAPDLSIKGYKDGRATQIFENGNWSEEFKTH